MDYKAQNKSLSEELKRMKEQMAQFEASASTETEPTAQDNSELIAAFKEGFSALGNNLSDLKASLKEGVTAQADKTAEAIASLGVKAPVSQSGDSAPVESKKAGLKRSFFFSKLSDVSTKKGFTNDDFLKSITDGNKR